MSVTTVSSTPVLDRSVTVADNTRNVASARKQNIAAASSGLGTLYAKTKGYAGRAAKDISSEASSAMHFVSSAIKEKSWFSRSGGNSFSQAVDPYRNSMVNVQALDYKNRKLGHAADESGNPQHTWRMNLAYFA